MTSRSDPLAPAPLPVCSSCKKPFYRHGEERRCPSCVPEAATGARDVYQLMRRSEARRLAKGLAMLAWTGRA